MKEKAPEVLTKDRWSLYRSSESRLRRRMASAEAREANGDLCDLVASLLPRLLRERFRAPTWPQNGRKVMKKAGFCWFLRRFWHETP